MPRTALDTPKQDTAAKEHPYVVQLHPSPAMMDESATPYFPHFLISNRQENDSIINPKSKSRFTLLPQQGNQFKWNFPLWLPNMFGHAY
jgi:hypothetical protein